MYVILTSKTGQFHTELTDGLRPLQAYDYLFYGQKRAHFIIAELLSDTVRIRVIEDETAIVNEVPSKFLERFDSVDRAYDELKHLTTFGSMNTVLRAVDMGAA